jgi:hypothetical protein
MAIADEAFGPSESRARFGPIVPTELYQMKIVPGNKRTHDHKGSDATERRMMWRDEEAARNQFRDWRRPVEPADVAVTEDLEMDCERWDGLA